MDCDHSGTHSGATRFSRQTSELRLVLVCDRCGSELNLFGRLDYCPKPEIEQALSPPSPCEGSTAMIAEAGTGA